MTLKIGVVIPVHNQAKNIPQVVAGYLAQSKMPSTIVFVLDRCSDNSKSILSSYATDFLNHGCELVILSKPYSHGFSAGMTRDFGINYLLNNTNTDVFVFTDGDCIPHPRLVERHLQVCFAFGDTPGVSCGARSDMQEDGTLTPDPRLVNEYNRDLVFRVGYSRYVVNPEVVEKSWACWSCNMAMNLAGLKLCLEINRLLTGVARVFNVHFDGKWGGEDGFIALNIFRCGGHVVMLDPLVDVRHIWHPRGHTNDSHLYVVDAMDKRLRALFFWGTYDNSKNTSVFRGLRIPDFNSYWNVDQLRCITSYAVPSYIDRLLQITALKDGIKGIASAWFLSRSVEHASQFVEPPSSLSDAEGQELFDQICEALDVFRKRAFIFDTNTGTVDPE